ncbi:MAG TPA: hypothetical protein ENJ38_07330 [Rhodospirillales bacterium]|nr:hypothetical protein [Rhodospirillales bacterium]
MGPLDSLVRTSDLWGWRLFIATLVWAPIPYASNRPWAWSILGLLVGTASVLTGVGHLRRGAPSRLPLPVLLAAGAGIVILVWVGLQSLAGILPPEWTHPVRRWAGEAGLPVSATISLSPELTRDNLMRLLTYMLTFAVAFAHGLDGGRARTLFRTIFVVASIEAVYGLLVHFGGLPGTFPWETAPKPYADVVTGTFINRNNFATFLGIGILVGLALTLEDVTKARGGSDLLRRLVAIGEQCLGKQGLRPAVLVALFAAALLTGSRGGFLSLVAGLLIFFFLGFLVVRPRWKSVLASLLVISVTGWGIFALAGNLTWERLLATEETGGNRIYVYELATEAVRARPWTGHGYGTFAQVFHLYRDARLSALWDKAHNTYLEQAVELGLPATATLYLGLAVLFLYMLTGIFRRRRNQIFPLVGVSASVLVGTHALVDFSLQIPAVATAYATVLGVGVAQARRHGRPRGTPEPVHQRGS